MTIHITFYSFIIVFLRHYVNCADVTIKGEPMHVLYNNSLYITCNRNNRLWGIGDATFFKNDIKFATVGRCNWYQCCISLLTENDNYDKDCSWKKRTLIIRSVHNNDNDAKWKCLTGKKISDEYHLVVTDSDPGCNLSIEIHYGFRDENGKKEIVLNEYDNLTINCTVKPNQADQNWMIYYENGTEVNIHRKFISKNVTRSDAGLYWCTGNYSSNCIQQDEVTVRVLYPAELRIIQTYVHSSINITCIPDGYPYNFTFYNWQHFVGNQFVRLLEGEILNGSSVLQLNEATVLDDGTYLCTASNFVADRKGNLNATQKIQIQVEASPLILAVLIHNGFQNATIGSDVEFTVEFLAINITLISSSQIVNESLNISKYVQVSEKPVEIHGLYITRNVSMVTTKLVNVSLDDAGNYTIDVCNEYGCDKSYFILEVIDKAIITTTDQNKSPNIDKLQSSDKSIIIGCSIALGIVFVAINIAVLRRRSKNLFKTNDKEKSTNHRYWNKTYSRSPDNYLSIGFDHHGIPNNIEQPNDLDIMTNELYVSADGDQIPDNSNDSMYVNDVDIMANELYVSADGDQTHDNSKDSTYANDIEIMTNEMYVSADDG